jgi:hypothetical protein
LRFVSGWVAPPVVLAVLGLWCRHAPGHRHKPRCLVAQPGPGSGSLGWSPVFTFSVNWYARPCYLDPMPAMCPG